MKNGFSKLTKEEKINWLVDKVFINDIEAKKLLGDILKVTIQPLLSKSEKDKKIDTLIHKAIESLNLDKE